MTILTQLLAGALPGYYASVQNPVVFGEHDERQPDLALVRAEALEGALPRASDVALVVEVAETSLSYDTGKSRAPFTRAPGYLRRGWLTWRLA